jgi:hypothetical protein
MNGSFCDRSRRPDVPQRFHTMRGATSQRKFAYIPLNTPAPCPPRSTFPGSPASGPSGACAGGTMATTSVGMRLSERCNIERELEPRMDADKHGSSRSYSYRQTHPKEVASDMRNLLMISVHLCPSAVLFSPLCITVVYHRVQFE